MCIQFHYSEVMRIEGIEKSLQKPLWLGTPAAKAAAGFRKDYKHYSRKWRTREELFSSVSLGTYERRHKMKKKILVCSLLVLFVLLTVTTAFAYDVTTLTLAYAQEDADFYGTMRGVNRCTRSEVGSLSVKHRCWLADTNGNRRSGIQVVSASVPKTYYLYPTVTGTLRLRIENYYYFDQISLNAKGNFSSSY